MHIIDRRLDPGGKSLANRQRFIRRARGLLRQAVRDAASSRAIREVGDGGAVSIPAGDVHEPSFHAGSGAGTRDHVLPGNKTYSAGDRIQRPPGGQGGGGSDGSPDGEGEDSFAFVLSREEFLDLFLEDLELPNMAKRQIMGEDKERRVPAGFRTTGSPAALSVSRTLRRSLSRRIALKRPSPAELDALRRELEILERSGNDVAAAEALRERIGRLEKRLLVVPFIDPVDLRFRRLDSVPEPVARAAMFCLMDVSGSMDEHMKDLAKRFFSLLYLFLTKRYKRVEIVFIRHTHEAKEVDEETFFKSRESGGTVVSSALKEMARIAAQRFPADQWNIYAAQASDGDNMSSDNALSIELLRDTILPMSQYYAYLEVGRGTSDGIGWVRQETGLWRAYERLIAPNLPMSMRKVGDRRDIYPVFRELFEKKGDDEREKLMSLSRRRSVPPPPGLLFEGADWDFDMLSRIYAAVEEVGLEELGLDIYPNQIEVITSEQMLDAYASTGMPLFYKHWSFGKQFLRNETLYRKGWQSLAYEIVINSSPCIVYIMEQNTATMQTLVLAHAAFGHNHFFKNNYVFRQWTDAEGIHDYLAFAKSYISACEERYGTDNVERFIDAAHALMSHGIHRSPRRQPMDLASEQRRERERREHGERLFNDLWRTVPEGKKRAGAKPEEERRRALLGLPEENVLYFLEKVAPRLQPWQREILRIVRLIAQYFYPQRQTKVMNEGCATYTHHRIMTRLHETGRINEGAFLEFLHSHTNVVMQPHFDDRRYGGINPYALGFAMMEDIERICLAPTDEDRHWFPDIAGRGDHMAVLRDAWANYRDESFVSQFLSPHLIRKLRLFRLVDDARADEVVVSAIHDERGYRDIRRALGRHYDVSRQDPNIQVVDVDLAGDRQLLLRHEMVDGIRLEPGDASRVLQHLADLWGYGVRLVEVEGDAIRATHDAQPRRPFM